jgi:hypothetical protein
MQAKTKNYFDKYITAIMIESHQFYTLVGKLTVIHINGVLP